MGEGEQPGAAAPAAHAARCAPPGHSHTLVPVDGGRERDTGSDPAGDCPLPSDTAPAPSQAAESAGTSVCMPRYLPPQPVRASPILRPPPIISPGPVAEHKSALSSGPADEQSPVPPDAKAIATRKRQTIPRDHGAVDSHSGPSSQPYAVSTVQSTKRRRTRGDTSAGRAAQHSDSTPGSPPAGAFPLQHRGSRAQDAAHDYGIPGMSAAAAVGEWGASLIPEAAVQPPYDAPGRLVRHQAPIQLPVPGALPVGSAMPRAPWPPYDGPAARAPHVPVPGAAYDWGRPPIAANPYAYPTPGRAFPVSFPLRPPHAAPGFDAAASRGPAAWRYPPPPQFEWMYRTPPPPRPPLPPPHTAWGYQSGPAMWDSPPRPVNARFMPGVTLTAAPVVVDGATASNNEPVPDSASSTLPTPPLDADATDGPSASHRRGAAPAPAPQSSSSSSSGHSRGPPPPHGARDAPTLDDVRKLFDMSLSNAAVECSMSAASFKRTCERIGIHRWPFRQLRALDQRIQLLQRKVAEHEQQGRVRDPVTNPGRRFDRCAPAALTRPTHPRCLRATCAVSVGCGRNSHPVCTGAPRFDKTPTCSVRHGFGPRPRECPAARDFSCVVRSPCIPPRVQ